MRLDPTLTAGGAVIKVGFDNAAATSEAAQQLMRLDPTLKAGGAVTKVGFENAAATSEAAQELMRLLPTLKAGGAVTKVGQANAPKHCYSSGAQTRYRCKWCNSPYESLNGVRKHGCKHHAEHFNPNRSYKPSYYCVEEKY